MTIMFDRVVAPGSAFRPRTRVRVRLVAADSGEGTGYNPGERRTIIGVADVLLVDDELFVIDLDPNAEVDPDNTVYEVTRVYPGWPAPQAETFTAPVEPAATTTVNAEALPTSTIELASTASLASSGAVYLGGQLVEYTGKTALDLTGCTGGTGTIPAGTIVRQAHWIPDHLENPPVGLPNLHVDNPSSAHAASAVSVPAGTVLPGVTVAAQLSQADAALLAADAAIDAEVSRATAAEAAIAAAAQPVDPDLTAIADLTTTAFGRGLLAMADGAALAGAIPSGTYLDPAGNLSDLASAATARANLAAAKAVPGVYPLDDYGTINRLGTGDNSAAMAACIAAWYAGGGGTIELGGGVIRVDDDIVIPNGDPSVNGAPKQPPLVWKGIGGFCSGQHSAPVGGTILLLRYQGDGSAGDAKIKTYGLGLMSFADVTLRDDTANSETPFVYATNTTIRTSRGFAMVGATGGVGCKQDGFILGGTTKPITTGYGDVNSAFQGYGTVIRDGYYDNIRRPVYGRSYCNQVQVVANIFDKGCGTNLAGGACVEFDGSLDPLTENVGDYCTNNVVIGNYFHWVGGYTYCVKGTKVFRTVVAFNGFIDSGLNQTAGVRLEGVNVGGTDYRSEQNTIIGNANSIDTHLSEDALSAGRNTLVNGGSAEGSVFRGRLKITGDARLLVSTPAPGFAFRISDGTTDFLLLGPGAGGTWSVGGPVTLVGNATGAGTTVLNIGNNVLAADAVINFNPPAGRQNHIQFKRAGVNSWLFYDANSTSFFFRDSVNAKMHLTFTPGAGTGGLTEVNSALRINGNVGFYNQAAIAKRGATADASDLATVITLANALKADLVAYGLKAA